MTGNFLSISVPRFKCTYSKESTPPASMCRWFRVVMEVVRWRLAWSNCFMSLVISLTCAGTSQTGQANNPQGERAGKTTWNEGGGQCTQKGKEEAQKRWVRLVMQYAKKTEQDKRHTHCFEKLFLPPKGESACHSSPSQSHPIFFVNTHPAGLPWTLVTQRHMDGTLPGL